MKVLLATHAFPPELAGGVELSVRELALALARAGHAVSVVAGTLATSAREGEAELARSVQRGTRGERIEVVRVARPDLYFDHWHKSLSAAGARGFRELLREVRPDVVHVHHWLRLSRDLVATSAREKIPAVVTLHDSWASCPIVFRVRPDTLEACDVPVGPRPCIACAGLVAPRTPWVARDAAFLLLAERQRDVARELELARARIVPSAAHGRALERTLGREPGSLAFEVIAPCAPDAGPIAGPAAQAEEESLRLVTWSQIARHKGIDLLLEAFVAARRRLAGEVELHLDLHGGEPDAAFSAHLRELARGEPVHWRGAFSSGELAWSIDPRAQVFVSATRAHESYGLAADEAARAGLAVLLPDAPVFVERLAGTARFFASGDGASLEQAIIALARAPGLVRAARESASAWAARLPGNDQLAQRHASVYAAAISAGAPQVRPEDWFAERMASEATLAWDRALASRTREELGL